MADGFVPLARQRPLEHECRGDECPEVAVGEMRGSFVHETIVAAPSDTRSAGRTRRCYIALREPWAVSPSSSRDRAEATALACNCSVRLRADCRNATDRAVDSAGLGDSY